MGNAFSVTVTGMDDLKKSLSQLSENVSTNVIRGAARAGAKVISDAVKSEAPVYSGEDPRVAVGVLKNAVYMVHDRELSTDHQQVFFVSLRRGGKEQKKGRDAYYWTWVEFGHRVVPRAPKGGAKLSARQAMPGGLHVAPHPFFRSAFNASKDKSAEAIRDYLAKRIPMEIEKLGPR